MLKTMLFNKQRIVSQILALPGVGRYGYAGLEGDVVVREQKAMQEGMAELLLRVGGWLVEVSAICKEGDRIVLDVMEGARG